MNSRQLEQRGNQQSQSAYPQGCSYLLAIGIDEYLHCPKLYNAVKDIEHVIAVLSQRYQFKPTQVFKLINQEATLRGIYQSLKNLQQIVQKEDEVIIYFSGHGTYNTDIKEGYWIPVDGVSDHPETFLPNSTLLLYFKSISSKHTLLIADSCFSGAFFGVNAKIVASERLASIDSRWVLTSGRDTIVSDGKPGENSPFAASIINNLNYNHRSTLRLSDLFSRVLEEVGSNTEQLPRCEPMAQVGHAGGEFVFRLQENVAPILDLKTVVSKSQRITPTSIFSWLRVVASLAALMLIATIIFWFVNRNTLRTPQTPTTTPQDTTAQISTENKIPKEVKPDVNNSNQVNDKEAIKQEKNYNKPIPTDKKPKVDEDIEKNPSKEPEEETKSVVCNELV